METSSEATASVSAAVRCTECAAAFPTRNQLFAHLKEAHGEVRITTKPIVDKKPRNDQPKGPPPPPQPKRKAPPAKPLLQPYVMNPSGNWVMPSPVASPTFVVEQCTWVPSSSSPDSSFAGTTLRGGNMRRTLVADSIEWLRHQPRLPRRCHVITSVPDIGELSPRLTPAEYEAWFSRVVKGIMEKLDDESIAIFYQTDGRDAGSADGAWLDKGLLCQLGARAAGALCVWQRLAVACFPTQQRHGRPGFAKLLCFSRTHRCAVSGIDVLPRGHQSYAGAMGETAAAAAVQYVLTAHRQRADGAAVKEGFV